MRWLVTGAAGQVGFHVVARLHASGEDVTAAAHRELDITDARSVEDAVARLRPDVVVNAAAYTAVDAAETDEAGAQRVNADGPAHLALACRHVGALLVHVSTDYVFDGFARRPYEPEDPPNPLSAYGRTKLAGEQRVLDSGCQAVVVRTAWVWGGPGRNFVATMRRLAVDGASPRVVADQTGSPTYSADLAQALVTVGQTRPASPILHFANRGQASWYDLAAAVFHAIGHDESRVSAIVSDDYPTAAQRPAWSVMSLASWQSAGFGTPPHWRDALARWAAAQPRTSQ